MAGGGLDLARNKNKLTLVFERPADQRAMARTRYCLRARKGSKRLMSTDRTQKELGPAARHAQAGPKLEAPT
jgi:hypothetical protein